MAARRTDRSRHNDSQSDCIYKELLEQHDNIAVMYVDRPDMDERVRTGRPTTKNKDDGYDHEIIVDFSLFTRGSQRKQVVATGNEESGRILHLTECDILETYKKYSDFERRNGKATFVPPLKMALDAAKIPQPATQEMHTRE